MEKTMATLGRPKQEGNQPGWMPFRAAVALEAYARSRGEGDKHEAALQVAVEHVKAMFPSQRCGITTIKRILAELFSRDSKEVFIAKKSNRQPELVPHPTKPGEFLTKTPRFDIALAARPIYRRANKAKHVHKP